MTIMSWLVNLPLLPPMHFSSRWNLLRYQSIQRSLQRKKLKQNKNTFVISKVLHIILKNLFNKFVLSNKSCLTYYTSSNVSNNMTSSSHKSYEKNERKMRWVDIIHSTMVRVLTSRKRSLLRTSWSKSKISSTQNFPLAFEHWKRRGGMSGRDS